MPAPFTIDQVEQSPEFAAKSYEEQQQIREVYLQQYVMTDPGFGRFDIQQQQEIMNAFRRRKPVLETPEPDSVRAVMLADQLLAADPENPEVRQAARAEYFKQSVVNNAGIIGWIVNGVMETVGLGNEPFTEQEKRDREKAFAYFDTVVKETNPGFAGAVDLGVPLGMTIADILIGKGVASLSLKALKAVPGVVSKAATYIDDAMSLYGNLGRASGTEQIIGQTGNRVLEWATKSALPFALDSTVDATTMVFRTMAQDQINAGNYGIVEERTFQDFASIFGQDFVFSMMGWAAFRALKNTVGGMTRAYNGFFNAERVISGELGSRDFIDQLDAATSGRLKPIEDIASNSADLRRASLNTLAERSERIGYSTSNKDDVYRAILLSRGYDVQEAGERVLVSSLRDEAGKVSSYGNLDEAFRQTFYAEQALEFNAPVIGGARTAQIRTLTELDVSTPAETVGKISTRAKNALFGASTATEVDSFITRTPAEIQDTLNTIVRDIGSPEIQLRYIDENLYMDRVTKGLHLSDNVNINTIFAPENITNPQTLNAFKEDFVAQMYKAPLTRGQKTRFNQFVLGFENANALRAQRGALPLFENQIKTLDPGASLQWNTGNRIKLTIFGQTAEYADIRQAMASLYTSNFPLIARSTGVETVEDWMKASFESIGQKFEVAPLTKDGMELGVRQYTIRGKGGQVIAQDTNLESLFRKRPDLVPRLPETLMPGFQAYNPVQGVDSLKVQGYTFNGSIPQIMEMNESYFNPGEFLTSREGQALSKVLIEDGTGNDLGRMLAFNRKSTQYEVTLPDIGAKAYFDTFNEAKEFLSKQLTDWTDMDTVARLKGIRLHTAGGGLFAQKFGSRELVEFSSLDDLKAFITEQPIYDKIGKEFTGEYGQIVGSVLPDEYQKMLNIEPMVNDLSLHTDLDMRKYWEEKYLGDLEKRGGKRRGYFALGYIGMHSQGNWDRLAQEVGDPNLYKVAYTDLARAMHEYTGQVKSIQPAIESLFKDVPVQRRKALLPLLEMNLDDEVAVGRVIQKLGLGELSGVEKDMLQNFRTFTNRMSDTFGIRYDRTINEYLPRIKKAMTAFDYKPAETIEEYAKRTGRELATMADPSMYRMRMKDVAEFAATTDPKDLLLMYVHQGYKNMIVKPAYTAARDYVEQTIKSGKMLAGDATFAVRYLEGIMSYESDTLQEYMRQASQQMGRTFNEAMGKMINAPAADYRQINDFTDVLTDLTVATTMSIRPWLPTRNLQQVWTILGSVLDPAEVWRAVKQLDDVGATKAFKEVLATGRLKTALTPLGETSQKYGAGYAFGNAMDALRTANSVLMKGYQNSDTWTRMIAHVSAGNTWDDAVKLLQDGKLNFDQFLHRSKLINLSEGDQAAITTIMQEQGPLAAKNLFIDRITDMSLFSYRSSDNPQLFKGFVGKLFGRFGHYPVSALNTYLTLLNKRPGVAMYNALRIGATTATFVYAMNSIGIKSSQFTPWGQAVFNGGPWFEVLNGIRESLDFSTFEGEQARTKLAQDVKRLLTPVQFTGLVEGIQKISAGDTYEGLARLLTVPYQGFDGIHE